MLTTQQRQTLLEAVKSNAYGSPFLWAVAKSMGLREHQLLQELENDATFEVLPKSVNGKNLTCLRFKLTREIVLAVLPLPTDHLKKAGHPQAAVQTLLRELNDAGLLHEENGQLVSGPGVAPAMRETGRPRFQTTGDAVEVEGTDDTLLTRDETIILSGLENIEEPRINFGLYETYTTFEEICEEPTVKRQLGDMAIRECLQKLKQKRHVIEPREGLYRSRISEMARLLKNVKQRFKEGDEDTAPYLVQSLQVKFQDRRRLLREQSFQDALTSLQQDHRSRNVRAASRLLAAGFSAALSRTLEEVKLTRVQERALLGIGSAYLNREGGGYVITGNTGSGKTEAALLPLLLGMLDERVAGVSRGVKVMLVYPRQNLAKNQLERICEYVAHLNRAMTQSAGQGLGLQPLSVGIVFGNTPEHEAQLRGERNSDFNRNWKPTQSGTFEMPYFTTPAGEPVQAGPGREGKWTITSGGGFENGGWKLETFQPTRKSILDEPPDILVITTEMLHRWLMDERAIQLFGLSKDYRQAAPFHPPRAIVMDEIHLYSGVHGAQIAALLRRFRHRVSNAMYFFSKDSAEERSWKSPLMIGMSATIGRPAYFWHELSGVWEKDIKALEPDSEHDFDEAQGRDYFIFIRPESFSRGKRIGDASAAIQTIMTISHNMVRRSAHGSTPAKFRSLIFQDSISKLKKLTVEFRDAESLKHLSSLRVKPQDQNTVFKSRAFMQGEYWYFDAADPYQFSEFRQAAGQPVSTLSSGETPVYSGSGQDSATLNRDIIFATTSLEVGYDDPSIQFVLQHHAPSNVASFVQKKGRAGRDLNDRPVTAVTLSRSSYRDAFYYHNTAALTDPSDYEPALNWENDFVQRFHAVALLLDELTARTGRGWQRVPEGRTLEQHLQAIHDELTRLDNTRGQFITKAYQFVTAPTLRTPMNYPTWQALWAWFTSVMLDPEVVARAEKMSRPDVLSLCPEFPENLFSSVNLPVVQVMYPGGRGGEWKFTNEDVALTFSELTPGRVSRRYGRHDLFWRPPLMKVKEQGRFQQNKIGMERYKLRNGRPGPFNPALVRTLTDEQYLGARFETLVPKRVKELYGNEIPARFYRLRYLELWSFGRLNPNRPKDPVSGAMNYGRRQVDGTVELKLHHGVPSEAQHHQLLQADWRVVSPETTSYPLSFSITSPQGPAGRQVHLPPLFGALVPDLEYFFGEHREQRSRLNVWEIEYGAEATIVLHKTNYRDQKAERGLNLVTYASEYDGQPLLYGFDMRTEGLRVPYNRDVLQELTAQIMAGLRQDASQATHLQDQFLRFLLKNEPWTTGVEGGLTPFSQRLMGDVLATMRAESRAEGQSGADFLNALTTPEGRTELFSWAKRYWADHRMLNEEFIAQAEATLSDGQAFGRLKTLFQQVQQSAEVKRFVSDTVIHSLKHASRNMFTMHGSADEQLVGSSAQLNLTHGPGEHEPAFYVYERNQDGAGSTRAAARYFKDGEAHSTGQRVKEWWRYTLECPVAEDEQLLKAVLAPERQSQVTTEVKRILALPPHERQGDLQALKTILRQVTQDTLEIDSPQMGRLATQLLSEIHILGCSFHQLDLLLELLSLERELSLRFHRLPLPTELAGYALQRVKGAPEQTPGLTALHQLYQQHFTTHIEDEDDEGENAADRFLAQVEALSVSTCIDACPACLASSCDLGHIDIMRHSVSRKLLKQVHQILTGDFTVNGEGLTVNEVLEKAKSSGGFVIHEHVGHLNSSLMRGLREAGFQQYGRIFDPERLKVRTVLYREALE